jgi:hypothetical protein
MTKLWKSWNLNLSLGCLTKSHVVCTEVCVFCVWFFTFYIPNTEDQRHYIVKLKRQYPQNLKGPLQFIDFPLLEGVGYIEISFNHVLPENSSQAPHLLKYFMWWSLQAPFIHLSLHWRVLALPPPGIFTHYSLQEAWPDGCPPPVISVLFPLPSDAVPSIAHVVPGWGLSIYLSVSLSGQLTAYYTHPGRDVQHMASLSQRGSACIESQWVSGMVTIDCLTMDQAMRQLNES